MTDEHSVEKLFDDRLGGPLVQGSGQPAEPKVSRLAVAACVLGVLSFIGGLTALPAIILGIIARIVIGRSGGQVTGRGFAALGINLPLVALGLFAIFILMPALNRVGEMSHTVKCMGQLKEISRAMQVYTDDYDGVLPRAGGLNTTWGTTVWNAESRAQAYSGNGASSEASISSCLYLLVKYADIAPESFVCKYDEGTTVFQLSQETLAQGLALTDVWDFGSDPIRHCSYSYHIPFTGFALKVSGKPGLAVASDRNPWLDSPAAKGKTPEEFDKFIPDSDNFCGNKQTAVIGNAITHDGKAQNVLFLDGHVGFERRSFCGLEDDNIFTRSRFPDAGDAKGQRPIPTADFGPANANDSLLLHDVDLVRMKPWTAGQSVSGSSAQSPSEAGADRSR